MREHGTHTCYVWGPEPGCEPGQGCRCDRCREANTAYGRRRARQVTPPYVGAATARAHVRFLADNGIGMKRVGEVAGVPHGTMWRLVYGKDGKPSRRIRRATHDRILAVQPADRADGARIDAADTWDRIDTLLEHGWTKAAIARAIGQGTVALQIGRRQVTAGNARAIAALLDEPVPPRRSRHGRHEMPQPDDEPATVATDAPTMPFILDDAAWRDDAACRLPGVPVWMFFPGRGDHQTMQAAVAVCETCPVKAACLDAHIDEPEGVWGGTSEKQRKDIRRRRRAERHDQEQEVA